LFRPTGEKREDKISALQDGPFEIVEASDSGVDYKIQRWGSIRAPHWVHVNEIKKLKRWRCEADSDYESEGEGPGEQLQEQAGDGAATAPTDKRKTWKVEAVVGERGKTRATKELRIKWLGHKQTTWELLSTLGADCPDVMREWALRPTEAKQKLAEASDTEVVALLAAYVEGAAT